MLIRMHIICFFFITVGFSQLPASGSNSNEVGINLGYAFLPDERNSYSMEGFIRHYFKQNVGIELSAMYIPGRTDKGEAVYGDIDPPLVIREEVTSYSVPLRFGVIYSPWRQSNFGASFIGGAGLVFSHSSLKLLDQPPAEFAYLFPEHFLTDGTFDVFFGATGEYAFTEKFFLNPRATVSYEAEGGFGLIDISLGVGYRF